MSQTSFLCVFVVILIYCVLFLSFVVKILEPTRPANDYGDDYETRGIGLVNLKYAI